MAITIYPGTVKKRNANGTYSDLIPGADSNPQLASDFADGYDSTSGVYSIGDYCVYQSVLYKCTTAISTPEAFNSSKWSAVTVTDEITNGISGVRTSLNQLEPSVTYSVISDFNTFKPNAGDINIRHGYSIGGTATNAPFSGDGATWRGYVEGSTNYCTQHFSSEWSNTATNRGRTYKRSFINGEWGAWIETADALDIASPRLEGTNTTGNTITKGTFFYNNSALVRAIADIQNGSAITGSNTQAAPAGGLNSLKDLLTTAETITLTPNTNVITDRGSYCCRVGNFVWGTVDFRVDSSITAYTVPIYSGFPTSSYFCFIFAQNRSSPYDVSMLHITANGFLARMDAPLTTGKYYSASFIYITNQ